MSKPNLKNWSTTAAQRLEKEITEEVEKLYLKPLRSDQLKALIRVLSRVLTTADPREKP